ncbi:MAG: flagellar hook-length control protein FliK [Spirochaetales bacterium]|uniref:Flagellar hook-length control protein FliK n=1 Tax=Candidatus Thalassospirochaeta sargassi TaxID=3119039 RepID=A0AAJ1ILY1_9SPIO|nr:flagellar hook-length control protein FliK [Spirochaetales bacterium]
MNSALVQILPASTGGGYNNTSQPAEAFPEKGNRFNDAFEHASTGEVQQKAADQEVKKTVKSEKGSNGKKSEKDEVCKSEKPGNTESESAVGAAAAEESPKAVETLKKGLGGEKKTLDTDENSDTVLKAGLKKSDSVKLAVVNASKNAKKGAGKTASLSSAAGMLNGEGSRKKVSGAGSKADIFRLDRNSLAGKPAEADAETAKDISEALKTKNAGIEITGNNAEKAADAAGVTGRTAAALRAEVAEDAGEGGNKKTKLRVSDHRTVASASDKNAKTLIQQAAQSASNPPSSVSGNEQDASAKIFNLASEGAGDTPRADAAKADTRIFQSNVLSQLKDDVNSQIVKQAGIVVKGNGTGEIKLVMKPESLGKVRIQLSLNDNHIAGRIIVENNIVREIFESNLENLYKAFGSEGFENGGLEVSVQGQGHNAGANGRRQGRGPGVRAAKVLEAAVPEVVNSEWQNNAVNMVV